MALRLEIDCVATRLSHFEGSLQMRPTNVGGSLLPRPIPSHPIPSRDAGGDKTFVPWETAVPLLGDSGEGGNTLVRANRKSTIDQDVSFLVWPSQPLNWEKDISITPVGTWPKLKCTRQMIFNFRKWTIISQVTVL